MIGFSLLRILGSSAFKLLWNILFHKNIYGKIENYYNVYKYLSIIFSYENEKESIINILYLNIQLMKIWYYTKN